MTADHEPHPRTLAARAYLGLLRLYPEPFFDRFGGELFDLARQRRSEPRYATAGGALRLALHLGRDLARSVPDEWHAAWRRARLAARSQPVNRNSGESMHSIIQDIRFALRSLARRPGFTFVAALTLALGIGATSAIFSVVNEVLIKPLPYTNPDRLFAVWGAGANQHQLSITYPDYVEWREQNHSFDDMGVFRSQSVNLTGGETPQRMVGSFVSASFLRVIGVKTERGRLLTDRETEIATKEPAAVVSYEAWQTRFGGDSTLLGKAILLNGVTFHVIGITRPNTPVPPFGSPDVFLPMPFYPNAAGLDRGNRSIWAIGRLKPGVTPAAATADLAAIARHQEELYPATNQGAGIELQPLKEQLVGPARDIIYLVFASVGVVLLIACANVANLQLARGASRQRELSVRAALGASRWRIRRHLLTESMILAIAGGTAGMALAWAGTRWLSAATASLLPPNTVLSVNAPVLFFAMAVSMLSGILFGLMPAWKASRAGIHDMLRTRVAGAFHAKTRNALVIAQLALSLTLLACAGLLTRSLVALQRVDTGFDSKNLMTMQFRLPPNKYDTPAKIWAMFEQTIAEIRAVPGVESAALARSFPLTGNGEGASIVAEDLPAPRPGEAPNVMLNSVTPGYFATMHIPRISGRDFAESDRADAPPAIVVNTEYANRIWPGQSPIGKRVRLGADERWWTIIGVVGTVKNYTLSETPLLEAYVPHAQRPQIFTTVAVRAAHNPTELTQALRQAIWRVDKDQPVWGIVTAEQLIDNAVGSPRLTVALMAGFAIVALLLAAVGVYGVLTYSMAQRTHEVGIRMALGAQRAEVVRMVILEGMKLVAISLALGLAASIGAVRLLRTQLYGVGPGDPGTFAAVTIVLSAVALFACYLPARRASRVDPTEAMRVE